MYWDNIPRKTIGLMRFITSYLRREYRFRYKYRDKFTRILQLDYGQAKLSVILSLFSHDYNYGYDMLQGTIMLSVGVIGDLDAETTIMEILDILSSYLDFEYPEINIEEIKRMFLKIITDVDISIRTDKGEKLYSFKAPIYITYNYQNEPQNITVSSTIKTIKGEGIIDSVDDVKMFLYMVYVIYEVLRKLYT